MTEEFRPTWLERRPWLFRQLLRLPFFRRREKSCLAIIARDIAKMPVTIWRKDADGTTTKETRDA